MKTKYQLVEQFYSPAARVAKHSSFEKYLTLEDALKASTLYESGNISKRQIRKLIDEYMLVRRAELRKRDRIRKGYL